MTTKFEHVDGRITVTLNPESTAPLAFSMNIEAAVEWRAELDRCLAEAGQATWRKGAAAATKRRTKKVT